MFSHREQYVKSSGLEVGAGERHGRASGRSVGRMGRGARSVKAPKQFDEVQFVPFFFVAVRCDVGTPA